MKNLRTKLTIIANGDEAYKIFHSRIVNDPTVEFIGVRIPALRKIAREIAQNNWQDFLATNSWKTHEEKFIACVLPQYIKPKPTLNELFDIFNLILPHVSNWALTDSMAMKFPQIISSPVEAWSKTTTYIRSKDLWVCRFGIVLAMANFINDEYVDGLLSELQAIETDEYYIKMAAAWCIAEIAVTFREKAEKTLSTISPDISKISRQKMRDSRRI